MADIWFTNQSLRPKDLKLDISDATTRAVSAEQRAEFLFQFYLFHVGNG